MILLLTIIYAVIGAFIAGLVDENETGWIIVVIAVWPLILLFTLTLVILRKPYELGQKMFEKRFDITEEKSNETN